MFPVDPNAPGGPDRSRSLQRSYLDQTPVRERLMLRFWEQNRPPVSCCVLSGPPMAVARQSGTIRDAELITGAAADRGPTLTSS
jgi:hypothetical protein